MAEFSHIKDIISTAQAVEDAVQYDLGTRHMEGAGGGHIPLQWPTPVGCRGVAQHIPKANADSADLAKGNGELRSTISDAEQFVCAQGCRAMLRS